MILKVVELWPVKVASFDKLEIDSYTRELYINVQIFQQQRVHLVLKELMLTLILNFFTEKNVFVLVLPFGRNSAVDQSITEKFRQNYMTALVCTYQLAISKLAFGFRIPINT